MAIHRLELTLNEDDWARLETLRGHEPRASFVKRVLRQSFSLTRPENTVLIPDAPVWEKSPRIPAEAFRLEPAAPDPMFGEGMAFRVVEQGEALEETLGSGTATPVDEGRGRKDVGTSASPRASKKERLAEAQSVLHRAQWTAAHRPTCSCSMCKPPR